MAVTWIRLTLRKLRGLLSGDSGHHREGYRPTMSTRIPPVPRPANLSIYEGMWVAVVNGEVVAADGSSNGLALELRRMDHRKRDRAVVEYVRPRTDAYIVGLG